MNFNKGQTELLNQIAQGPVTFKVEWLMQSDGVTHAHVVKNHRLYWNATGLSNVGLATLTEVSTIPGRSNVTKWRCTGNTVITTYRIEK